MHSDLGEDLYIAVWLSTGIYLKSMVSAVTSMTNWAHKEHELVTRKWQTSISGNAHL